MNALSFFPLAKAKARVALAVAGKTVSHSVGLALSAAVAVFLIPLFVLVWVCLTCLVLTSGADPESDYARPW
ncbi:MAG: hypothetical protein JWQ44_1232 [Chthoniobacter sp.]|jgi:hypothetical protein|nr:hypothetical protein [Chthoniobacter sp.]